MRAVGDPRESLRISDLNLSRNGERILRDLNLEVRRGEVHSILGMNGTGKSTLAYTIMGLSGYQPQSGRIVFEGQDITAMPVQERARLGITLAWQEPARFEGLSVEEYLRISSRNAQRTLPPEECLRMVGLRPERYLRRIVDNTLSGGERKRIELASVLAMQPKLVILDEPDSGIDALSIDYIVEDIRAFVRQGSSVLLITHHEDVARMADRASSLCGGTILKTGLPEEVARFFRNHCRECPHVNEPDREVYRYA
ncbi:MAG: ABC transporter ATP-binding protein [candidate division KSB1 bacterium]|nr:ABC transporter ATP-binding protein [candidate division KSB1 bacterium]